MDQQVSVSKPSTNGRPDGRAFVLAAVEEHEGRLARYALRLAGDEHLARDAVQHAFMKLCDQPPERVSDHLAPWLFAVCRNRILDAHKENGRMKTLTDEQSQAELPLSQQPATDPADCAAARDAYQTVRRAVALLPENQREAVDLWADGFRYQEIAEVIGCTEGHVRVLVHRGLNRVREHPQVREMM